MGRLECAVKRELAVHLVHRRHAAAGLKRAGVRAMIIHHLFGHDGRVIQHLLGCGLIPHFPGEDVIVMFAWPVRAIGDCAIFACQILAENHI